MLSGQALTGFRRDVLPELTVWKSPVRPFAYSVQ